MPLAGALFAADQFLSVLGYAGIILVFLAVFIPMAMTMKLRQEDDTTFEMDPSEVLYRASGGQFAMGLSFLFGCFLLAAELI